MPKGEQRCQNRRLGVSVTRKAEASPVVQGSRPLVMAGSSFFTGSATSVDIVEVNSAETVALGLGATSLQVAALGLSVVGLSLF